MAHVIKLIS